MDSYSSILLQSKKFDPLCHILADSTINQSFNFAVAKIDHLRTRNTGQNYIEHLFETASILASHEKSPELIASGLCYDFLDENVCSAQELIKFCGWNIYSHVLAVSHNPFKEESDSSSEIGYLDSLISSGKDAILLKIASEISTLSFLKNVRSAGAFLRKSYYDKLIKFSRTFTNHPLIASLNRIYQSL